jgi:hypothetical protein
MYYVVIAERSGPAVARNIGRAHSSTEARRLAKQLDLSLHGHPTGRLFYLDEPTFDDWCLSGRALRTEPGKVVMTSKPCRIRGRSVAQPHAVHAATDRSSVQSWGAQH